MHIKATGLEYNFPVVDIAAKGDLAEILALQKLAYRSEAEIYNNYAIAPLVQTLQELREEAAGSIILKVVEDRRFVGSVRAFVKDGTCHIGKLIVHPDYRDKGIGKNFYKLLKNALRE
jgi:ribosomal protein S18 acetylase RimI-like enzyme